MAREKIVIMGAGLVGSLLALSLGKRGFDVTVFERRPDIRKTGGVGGRSINLALSDRGLEALKLVGLEEKIKSLSIPMYGRMIHNQDSSVVFQPYGLTGQAINSVSRGSLNIALAQAAEESGRVALYFDQRCEEIIPEKGEIHLQNAQNGEKSTVHADIIIGADGAFSAVRGSLMKQDRFNYSQQYLDHAYKELAIPPGENGSFKMDRNCLHIWPRKQFMLIALPNLDGSFTCTLFLPFSGKENSFAALPSRDDVDRFFKKEFPDAHALMPTLLEDFFTNPTSSLMTVRCQPWSNGQNCFLIGDAAHAIVPFYGQGMNAGFEDCSVFNQLMDNFTGNWSRLIHEYETLRKPNADAIADLALYNFIEMRDFVADPRFLLRKKIEKHLHEEFPERFTPVYSMVSFSHLPYSEAWKELQHQNRVFEEILSWPDIESRWNHPETAEQMLQLLSAR